MKAGKFGVMEKLDEFFFKSKNKENQWLFVKKKNIKQVIN